MNEVNTFTSRFGALRTLRAISSSVYQIEGESIYHRCGYNEGGTEISFADMEGGPFVQLGDCISFYGAKNDSRRIIKIELDAPCDTRLVISLHVE